MKLSKIKRSKAFDFLGKIFGRRRGGVQLRHRGRGGNSAQKLLRDRSSFHPVYVDELYNQQPAEVHAELVELVSGEEAGKAMEKAGETAGGTATAATATIASDVSSPYRDGVEEMDEADLRAEMFIRKFKEEMRRQGERSSPRVVSEEMVIIGA